MVGQCDSSRNTMASLLQNRIGTVENSGCEFLGHPAALRTLQKYREGCHRIFLDVGRNDLFGNNGLSATSTQCGKLRHCDLRLPFDRNRTP